MAAPPIAPGSPLLSEYLEMFGSEDRQKIAHPPMTSDDALLVIDMQNDFVPFHKVHNPHGGNFGVPEGHQTIELIASMINSAAEVGASVVATRDYHTVDHASFISEGGPFPAHCVQGTKGSYFLKEMAAALAEARQKDAKKVHVGFKAFHEDVDSFGGLPYKPGEGYPKGPEDRVTLRAPGKDARDPCVLGCTESPWTGCCLLKQSALMLADLECTVCAEDMNAPPDILAIEEDETNRRGRMPLQDYLKNNGCKRLFVCGLALDYCVSDTCLNAMSLGFEQVFIVLDACRAAHIEGVGGFGSGFLQSPPELAAKFAKAGVQLTFTPRVTGLPSLVSSKAHLDGVANQKIIDYEAKTLSSYGLVHVTGLRMECKSDQYSVEMGGDLERLKTLGFTNTGRCSPPCPIPKGWAGAPPEATKICWANPLVTNLLTKEGDPKALLGFLKISVAPALSFAVRGGFLLLSDKDEVLLVQMVTRGNNIDFSPGLPCPKEVCDKMEATQRQQACTLNFLKKEGCLTFCWHGPNEQVGTWTAPSMGAFSYTNERQEPIMFPISELKV